MIFVTVGTTEFNTLIKKADALKNEDLVIQYADGEYQPKNYPAFNFSDEISHYYKNAEIIITHGGAGTIFKLLGLGKKIIGMANLERTDKHQTDLLKKLSDEGYLIWCQDPNRLKDCIKKAREIKLKKYSPPKSNIAAAIQEFLR